MTSNKRILVVVAHPDDEILGCGGTLARHLDEGCEVTLLVLTDGVGARRAGVDVINTRSNELQQAAQVLGISSLLQHSLPDNELDSIPILEVVRTIAPTFDSVNPHIVYTHFLYDLNQDHCVVARAIRILTRPIFPLELEKVLMMEVPSSTEWAFGESAQFSPNYFVNLNAHQLDLKLKALSKYSSELREPPHPRRVEHALVASKYRGAQSGCEYAEAFMVLRSIN